MKHWVLIGFMGSGKSTLASLLSDRFSLPIFSTDQKIEEEMQMSVAEIFSNFGEEFFRKKEAEIFLQIQSLKKVHIIDCGGGFSVYQDVNLLGEVFFLDVSFEEIMQKMSDEEKKKRPLFSSNARELFLQRRAIYQRKADKVIKNFEDCLKAVSEENLSGSLLP